MATAVKQLDRECSKKIRFGQVINKVSDVVRELVDNAVDAGARSIQVLLDNYGLKRVEVKDNGHGIPAEDVHSLFQGGYTSKLDDDNHLSCKEQYGFRGEALAAVCSLNGLVVVTKTEEDNTARRFVISKQGRVTAESVVPLGTGTVITVREMFKDYPVRYKHSAEAKVQRNQLKDIEFYMKCLGIANPLIYFSLYHNGNLIWSKPAVKNVEQALTTVLGVALAKNLSGCLSEDLVPELKENEEECSWKGSLQLFVPKKPVDLRSMGFTTNKMTMVFVNRRLVSVEEYQNMIKRYAIGGAENPTLQEQRKSPLAVLIISVPPNEVDFNRETDKSKVFLTCHETVMAKLESMLQTYYGISLSVLGGGDLMSDLSVSHDVPELNISSGSEKDVSTGDVAQTECTAPTDTVGARISSCLAKTVSTPEKRKENIMSFLGSIPSSGSFSNTSKESSVHHIGSASPQNLNGRRAIFPINEFTLSSEKDADRQILDVPVSSSRVNNHSVERPCGRSATNNNSENVVAADPLGLMRSGEVSSEGPLSTESARNSSISAPVESTTKKTSSSFMDDMNLSLDSIPQCGAVIHTEDITRGTSCKRTLSESSHEPKRMKLLDSPVASSTTSEGWEKRSRQVTLDCLKNWSAGAKPLTRFTAPIRRPSICADISRDVSPERVPSTPLKISAALLPRTMEYLKRKEDSFGLSETAGSSILSRQTEHSSVLGITATIEVGSFSDRSATQRSESSCAGEEMQVISKLPGTPYYIVKIDGLLGVFNPPKFLEFLRVLDLDKEASTTDCHPKHLLQEFAKGVENIDDETAEGIFKVIADLHEENEKS